MKYTRIDSKLTGNACNPIIVELLAQYPDNHFLGNGRVHIYCKGFYSYSRNITLPFNEARILYQSIS